jgi:hypothetical protein
MPRRARFDSLGTLHELAEVRGKSAYLLSREKGMPPAEIGRNLSVGTSAIAMAIRKKSRAFN